MEDHTELIKLVSKDDPAAFNRLYDIFSNKVYNTCLSYLQNVEDAEEVTQDVFTNVFRSAHKFKGNSSLNTWIYRIAINGCINFSKKRSRKRLYSLDKKNSDKPDFEHPGVKLENKESSKLLFNAIDKLPKNQKTAFILSFIEGLPRKEVANIMEVSLKAVESLLQRSKKNLRLELQKYYPNRRKK